MEFQKSKWQKWRISLEPSDLYSAISPMFYCCRILGMLPITITQKTTGPVLLISKYGIFYNISMLIFLIIFFQMGVEEVLGRAHTFDKISNVAAWGQVYAVMLVTIVAMMTCLFRQKRIINVLKETTEVDESLKDLNVVTSYKNVKVYTFLQLLLVFGIIFGSVMSNCIVMNMKQIRVFSLCYWFICFFPISINMLMECQFCNLMLLIRQRMATINYLIDQYSMSQYPKIQNEADPKVDNQCQVENLPQNENDVQFMDGMCAIHGILCKLAKEVNSIYGFYLLCNISVSFGVITIQLYYVFSVTIGYVEMHTFMLICTLIWTSVNVASIVLMVAACTVTREEAKKTGAMLHMIKNVSNDSHLYRTIEMFSLQILHNDLKFTACGFFNLDFKLPTSIFAAVTTYLIIIIQFQLGSNCASGSVNAVIPNKNV